ncbi:MAG: ECF transporter S component [Butyrivibrio sp.]|uniref:Uncharacterized membrane protein n=1 Tax=Butyrivibrio hungatei TaxID=185008 RepID=A0A1G5G891_9FIRM|nr:ECF transporter S component [Butyrivibrio hungatei]MBQ2610439.1 ECF transporter S component [Butyrivibrio sp.]MBQ4217997.1 ECF transporter S component [Butyrivibrio sp.]MBR4357122.1 ECF transporter S component [Butyrivibrio sp.]MCR4997888.1 ECF transporter S component [Butyrivibrio sp.]SCY47519.1 Uncharacterized membrane protein [Butyrivibrio hungatei]
MTQTQTNNLKNKNYVRWIALTGLFMGLNIIMSSFGIPVPGGHLYLCDLIICTAALLLDPLAAFVVGGIGSFLGDVLFYPAPMFVSLVTHGLQAAVISIIVSSKFGRIKKTHFITSVVATLIGAVIMVVGYTLGKIYVYSTFEYAMIKLPYEIAQALLGVVGSLFLCYKLGLMKIFRRMEFE